MKARVKLLAFAALFALLLTASIGAFATPAQAATPVPNCTVSPSSGPVGTKFGLSCWGFSPNTIINIYAVEPDGRDSGLNIYGFFPTELKTSAAGKVSFTFATKFPGLFSVPPGTYIFIVQQLGPGNTVAYADYAVVTVTGAGQNLGNASLSVVEVTRSSDLPNRVFAFSGSGFVPGEAVNNWVTQPPATECSGLGIDQLTLGALGLDSSSLWFGPGTVKADGSGHISFTATFRPSACRGTYALTSYALVSGRGAFVTFDVTGVSVTQAGVATVWVSPNPVPSYHSDHTVYGSGFPANTGVSCWYTRPDGRVLAFIGVNAKTNGGGSFSAKGHLDDFPPYTSTEPGWWFVTCATQNRSTLAVAPFYVVSVPPHDP